MRGSGPVGEAAAPAHGVQPPLGALAHRARGDDEQLVAVPQHVVVARHERAPLAHDERRRWRPTGRRSSNTRTPAIRDPGPMSISSSSAPSSLSGRGLHGEVDPVVGRRQAEPARHPGQRRRLHEREDDDEHEDEVEEPRSRRGPRRCRAPWRARPARRRAAPPTTGTPGCATTSRTAGTTRAPTAGGRAGAGPRRRRGPATSTSRKSPGCASSPSSTNRPIWASQPIAVANPSTAGRCGIRWLPSTSAAR